MPKFSYSARKTEFSIHKVYLNDISFIKIFETTKDYGKVMENVVFIELLRRNSALTELFYWKNQQQEEVDFVVKEKKIVQLIQVCAYADADTSRRELRSLLKASKELHCENLFIITLDEEKIEHIDNKKIEYIPLLKWLLKKE